jgi:hypothetical protein
MSPCLPNFSAHFKHFGLAPPAVHSRQLRVSVLSAGNPSQRAHFSPERKNPYGHAPKHISLFPAQFPQLMSVQGLHTADSIASPAGHIRAFVRATPVIKIAIKPIIEKTAIHDFDLP